MIGNYKKKKKKEYASFNYTFLEKARCPVRIDKQQFWTEKAKSFLGFKPSQHGQNAGALPLAPVSTGLRTFRDAKYPQKTVELKLSETKYYIPGFNNNGNFRKKPVAKKSVQAWNGQVCFFVSISFIIPQNLFLCPSFKYRVRITYKVVAVAVAEWLLSWPFAKGSKKLPFSLLGLFHGCDLLTKPNPAINPDFYI